MRYVIPLQGCDCKGAIVTSVHRFRKDRTKASLTVKWGSANCKRLKNPFFPPPHVAH